PAAASIKPRLSKGDAMSPSDRDSPGHGTRKATRCRLRMGIAPAMAPERRRDVAFGWGWHRPWRPKGDAMSPSDRDSPGHGARKATRCRLRIVIPLVRPRPTDADVCAGEAAAAFAEQ